MAELTRPIRVLLLGGTREARELAERLAKDGKWSVITSLAGRTSEPEELAGEVRIGGFGGAAGLADYIKQETIDIVVDATHPFAETISTNASIAAKRTECSYLRLCRPFWQTVTGDHWLTARDVPHAAELIGPDSRVLLTIGRQELAPFLQRSDLQIVARMIEAPDEQLPPHAEVILARPPFSVSEELALLRDRRIDVLVTKNAGGSSVEAKLIAARQTGLPVVMVERPAAAPSVDAETVDDLMCLLHRHYAT